MKRGLIAAAAALLAGIAPAVVSSLPAAAQALPTSVTINITKAGFDQTYVTMAQGGSVTWNNQDDTGHSIDTQNAPFPIYMGVSPGQTFTVTLSLPGVYHYTAATDCLNGVSRPPFACVDYVINVVAPGEPLPSAFVAPAATPTPTPLPEQQGVLANATANIDDGSISPRTITITVGGNVTWTNHGTRTHTVSSRMPQLPPIDSGGLGVGQSWNSSFSTPGTYSYTSETDCLDGNKVPGFDCGPYTLVVTTSAPSQASAAPAAVQPASNTTVGIDDTHGFQPAQLTIKLGQSVTWVNNGTNVHSAVSNAAGLAPFDSGGLGPGQSFTWAPPAPGTYPYQSSTDTVFVTDPVCNCPKATYPFQGTIVVGQ